jgi:phosphoribosylamine--glycine ligase
VKVLVLGSGAREHALVLGLSADPEVDAVIAAPGNPGIDLVARCEPLADLLDVPSVVSLARRLGVDLVVVGPEAPLVAGVADGLAAAGIACFGPSAAAARLEGSKAFAKEVMASAGVPTALAHVCTSLDEVASGLDALGAPYVVKDDGLAAGKGVVVTDSREEALAHAASCLSRDGGVVVVEEYLDGPEVSVFCITDGSTVLALDPAQDFKRVGNDDTGLNTGGMGAYCPLPWLPEGFTDLVVERVAKPTIDEMRRRGTPYVGTLYVGLAVTSRGPRVVEFNARFGDPDSQVVLARLRTGLGVLLRAAATGHLEEFGALHWLKGSAVSVVLAAAGYPVEPIVGDPIGGLDELAAEGSVTVLHGGTRRLDDGTLVSAGGRVLNLLAVAPDLSAARALAYDAVARVDLKGSHYRSDIAARAAAGLIQI